VSCAVCGRGSRGYGFRDPVPAPGKPNTLYRACSLLCLDVIYHRWKMGEPMFNLTHYEERAIDAASDAAGEYLERIGKTDLASLTPNEWLGFLKTVFVTSTATIQRLTDEDAVPF
jgi:hypothetical protein